MTYAFSHLPNTGHAKRFKVRNAQKKDVSFFNFSRSLIGMWGNPLEEKLERFMIAYIKRHGWVKEPVVLDSTNSPKNLSQFIASLQKK